MTNELLEKLREIEKKQGKDWWEGLDEISTAEDLKQQISEWEVEIPDHLVPEMLEIASSKQAILLSDEELSEISGGTDSSQDIPRRRMDP